MPNTERLRARAAVQHALLTRGDLDELGTTPGQRRGLIARGELVRIAPRLHRIGGAPETAHQAVLAACLDAGGVAAGPSAAWLHRLDGFGPGDPPTVLVRRPVQRRRSLLAEVHSTRWLPDEDVLVVQGIPCLNLARTFASLAARVPDRLGIDVLAGAVEQAVTERKASERWLRWHLERLRASGRDGVAAYDEVLAERAGGAVTESWLERETIVRLRGAGLPLPDCQVRIPAEGGFVARVDFTYLTGDVVMEVSGYRWHRTSSPDGQRPCPSSSAHPRRQAGPRSSPTTTSSTTRTGWWLTSPPPWACAAPPDEPRRARPSSTATEHPVGPRLARAREQPTRATSTGRICRTDRRAAGGDRARPGLDPPARSVCAPAPRATKAPPTTPAAPRADHRPASQPEVQRKRLVARPDARRDHRKPHLRRKPGRRPWSPQASSSDQQRDQSSIRSIGRRGRTRSAMEPLAQPKPPPATLVATTGSPEPLAQPKPPASNSGRNDGQS
ncbi:hypothetical protein KSP35_02275 [Aquihabitans sp. G128]|uniref:hypothetical protein n=1 Tax=Aquihabitans sp. G128 TaxID=2849779 RepID=UPI001C23030B|nr:hypothetical protein [Aquihabitans sp. G128]QXC61694.1 hypothetical protein KSP35_02275 [Aquihabitans sp. G128]